MIRKKECKYVLSLDPSGNFNEGKGVTGWVLSSVEFDRVIKFGSIDAGISMSMEDHWDRHISLIDNFNKEYEGLHVVMEDYMLYASRASTQINSRMETPKLIGVIQYYCFLQEIPLTLETAVAVKKRWTDEILTRKGYLTYQLDSRNYRTNKINGYPVSNHVVDALRHNVHYRTFKIKK